MKTDIKLTQIASIAAALFGAASLAAAPATPVGVNPGVGAVGNVAGGMHGPAFGGFGSASSTGAAAIPGSTNVGSAASGGVSATGAPGLSAGGNASGIETIGMRQARLSAQTADNTSVHGVNANAGGMDSLNAGLNTGPAIDGIRATKFAARDKLRADVDASIGAGERTMSRIEAGIKDAKEASQADFRLAQKAVIAREKDLKASVAATAGATADTWVRSRQRVAVAFSAYAAGVAQARLKATEASTGAHANASATAALAMESTPAEISEASLDARDRIDTDLRMKMETSEKAMAQLADRSADLGADAKANVKAAVKEANAREKDLRKSLKASARAGADTWEDARSSVALNYNLYAEAVAHAESVAMAQAAASGSATVVSTVK